MGKKAGYMFAGSGTPIVFLHCSMSSKEQWFQIFNELKQDYAVLAVDLYGYGESPFPGKTKHFSLDMEIELIESAMEETIGKNANFHLVGHSYGGAVAMRYSSLDKSKNISLSIYEPMLNHVFRETDEAMYRLGIDFISDIENDVINGDPDLGCTKFIDLFSGDGTYERLPGEIKDLFRKYIKKMPMDYRATIGDELSLSKYENIDIPVCLMAGEKSVELTLDISDKLSTVLKNVEYHKINGTHMAPIEKPDLVNSIIKEFILKV